MNINITFIIQIINFWVTYFMLHKLLFKPVFRHLHQKEFAKNLMLEKLKGKEKKLFVLQEKKSALLFDFRRHLQVAYSSPIIQQPAFVPDIFYKKNPEEIRVLIDESKTLLVKKVSDVYTA